MRDLCDEELIRLGREKAAEVAQRGEYLVDEVSRGKQAGPVGELVTDQSEIQDPLADFLERTHQSK